MTAVALPEVPEGFSKADAVSWVAEGGIPLMDPQPGLPFADYECEHGRIAGDRLDGKAPNWPHTHACGCWPGERGHAPDLMTTLNTAKEAAMTPAIVPTKQYDRPIGPRRRPGRPPKAKTAAAPERAAAPVRPVADKSDVLAQAAAIIGAEIARIRAESDAEIAKLENARDAVLAVA